MLKRFVWVTALAPATAFSVGAWDYDPYLDPLDPPRLSSPPLISPYPETGINPGLTQELLRPHPLPGLEPRIVPIPAPAPMSPGVTCVQATPFAVHCY